MIAQFGIAVFGLVAIALTQSSCSRRRRWAPLFGLAGQPFWIYATATSGQLGMLIVSCAYTAIWIVGAWRQWVWRVRT
jgi:hypothetical protein